MARQVVKMVVRAAAPPAKRVEGMRRIAAIDVSVEVPFRYEPPTAHMRIAVACHLFHPELAAETCAFLTNIRCQFDLLISTDTAAKQAIIEQAFDGWQAGTIDVRIVANRGRDIGPKLTAYNDIYDRYDLVLFIHSKLSVTKSVDGGVWIDGSEWRRYLLQTLVGSPSVVSSVIEAFRLDPKLGIVVPQHWGPIIGFADWGQEFFSARRLAARMGLMLTAAHVVDFPAGSMFWLRPSALRPLLDLDLQVSDFPEEAGQVANTVAHAVERLFLYSCEIAGYRWIKISNPIAPAYSEARMAIQTPADLQRYWRRHGVRLTSLGPA